MKSKIIAEFLGTAFLVMIVFGSGISASQMFQAHPGLSLLTVAFATALGLYALIQCLGSISGAHLNPVISLVENLWGRLDRRSLMFYITAQITGAVAGVFLTHIMFNLPLFQVSTYERVGANLWISEGIATFGLVCTVALAGKKHVEFAPISIAAYVFAGYWFTSSTGFVNPAITLARTLTGTFCGMAPSGVIYFIAAQVIGALIAYKLMSKVSKHSDV